MFKRQSSLRVESFLLSGSNSNFPRIHGRSKNFPSSSDWVIKKKRQAELSEGSSAWATTSNDVSSAILLSQTIVRMNGIGGTIRNVDLNCSATNYEPSRIRKYKWRLWVTRRWDACNWTKFLEFRACLSFTCNNIHGLYLARDPRDRSAKAFWTSCGCYAFNCFEIVSFSEKPHAVVPKSGSRDATEFRGSPGNTRLIGGCR